MDMPSTAGLSATGPPMSSQIPTPITQLVWLLNGLIAQNPDQNADLIRLLSSSTSATHGDLSGENLDPAVLSNVSAHLAILSNILAQSHAANQEIPADLTDDSP